MKKKRISLVMALVLVLSCVIGGTLAWLTTETKEVKNTFTVGNINITLTETDSEEDKDDNDNTNAYKMIPDSTIAKDPTVTVKAGSEACWLFVKFEKSDNLDTFIAYEKADGWLELVIEGEKVEGVYYREVNADKAKDGDSFDVLKGNQVTVNKTVTKDNMDELEKNGNYPTLTFTAYAVQKDNVESVSEAWTIATATK